MFWIAIGILFVISGIVVILLTAGEGGTGSMLVAAGLALALTAIVRHYRYGDNPESDERSKKIGAYGITYAWLTGLIFMTVLFWLDCAGILRLGTQNALAASILVLALSAIVCQNWLLRKGDVG
jgi:hypothetical protein